MLEFTKYTNENAYEPLRLAEECSGDMEPSNATTFRIWYNMYENARRYNKAAAKIGYPSSKTDWKEPNNLSGVFGVVVFEGYEDEKGKIASIIDMASLHSQKFASRMKVDDESLKLLSASTNFGTLW